MATGGAAPSSAFANGQTIQVQNAAGIASAELAATTNNSNSYPTETAYHVIADFGVSGFHYAQGYYEAIPLPALTPFQWSSLLRAPAMVALLGVASSQQHLDFSGLSNLVADVPSTSTEASSIAHTYLGAGTYTAQMTSFANAGQTADYMADLMAVLIFSDSPSAAMSDSPQIPLSLSTQSPTTRAIEVQNPPQQENPPPTKPKSNIPIARYAIPGVAILIFAALAVAVIRLIIPRRKG